MVAMCVKTSQQNFLLQGNLLFFLC